MRGEREGRNPQGDQEPRVPGGDHSGRRDGAGPQRPSGRRGAGRGPGLLDPRRRLRQGRRHDPRRLLTTCGAPPR